MRRNLLRAPLLATASLALAAAAADDPQPLIVGGAASARLAWLRPVAGPGDDWINDLVPLAGGSVLAVGFLGRDDGAAAPDWRALALAFDRDGGLGPLRQYGSGGGVDAFWTAREAPDGRLVLAGFTTRIGAGGIDGWTVLTGAGGGVEREAAFGGAGYDRFTDLAVVEGGYAFLGHSQREGEDRRRLFLVRTDSALRPIWERMVEAPASLGALYVEAAPGGDLIVAGGIGDRGRSDMFAIRFDGEGRELWRRTFGSAEADDVNHGLVLLPSGRIVLVGYSRSWGARENDILAVTISAEGEVIRQEMLGGAADDRPILAAADAQGRVWVVGRTASAGRGGSDLLLARIEADGGFASGVLTLGSEADETGTAVRPLPDGPVLVAGYGNGLGGGEDAFIARIDGATLDQPHAAFRRRAVP